MSLWREWKPNVAGILGIPFTAENTNLAKNRKFTPPPPKKKNCCTIYLKSARLHQTPNTHPLPSTLVPKWAETKNYLQIAPSPRFDGIPLGTVASPAQQAAWSQAALCLPRTQTGWLSITGRPRGCFSVRCMEKGVNQHLSSKFIWHRNRAKPPRKTALAIAWWKAASRTYLKLISLPSDSHINIYRDQNPQLTFFELSQQPSASGWSYNYAGWRISLNRP